MLQGANTDARWRDKCKVRTPMQDGGANTNPNSNGPKLQRMNIYYNHVLCAVSVLLFLFSLVLVFAPSNCVSVLLLLCLLLLVLAPLCSLAPSLARSLAVFFHWLIVRTIALNVFSTILQYTPVHK